MKSLVLHNGKAWLEDRPDPTPENEWVVVKIEATTICGSDKRAFYSKEPVRGAGHEGTGQVVAVDKSSLLKVGDRVIMNPLSGCGECSLCRTGKYIYCTNKPKFESHFAQYVKIQDFVCSRLPDDISYETGALAGCALSPAFNSLKRLQVGPFDTVLITGLGPVGLGAVTVSKFRGAKVIAVETVPYRRELAKELGADVVLDGNEKNLPEMIKEAAGAPYLTKALDTSGNGQAERLCMDVMGPGGVVGFIGENNETIPVSPSNDFIRKGLTLLGAWHYDLNDLEEMLTLLRRSPVADKILTDKFGFSKVQEAFEKFVSGETGKVLLRPWE